MRNPTSYIAIRLGYEKIYGGQSSWDEVISAIKQYSLGQILDLVGRISAVLSNSAMGETNTQQILSKAIFRKDHVHIMDVKRQIETSRTGKDGRSAPVIIFDELLVISAVKIALLELDVSFEEMETSPDYLGKALLMLNNLIEKTPLSPLPESYDDPESRQKWYYYFFVNGLFHSTGTPSYMIGRYYDLFFHEPDNVSHHEKDSSLSPRQLMINKFGLTPEVYLSMMFAMWTHWKTITSKNASRSSAFIKRGIYLKNLRFSDEEKSLFFHLASTDAGTLKKEFQSEYRFDNFRPYHFVPLAKNPLILIGDTCFCPSSKLILEKITSGLYHTLLNSIESEIERNTFQIHVGQLFENYTGRILERIFNAKNSLLAKRYIGSQELRNAIPEQGRKICDGIIIYPQSLILIETKAMFFNAAARSGDSIDDYESKLQEIFLKSSEQMDSTINCIAAGQLEKIGIGKELSNYCFPLILSLQDLPVITPIYNVLSKKLAKKHLLEQGDALQRLQFMSVDELELMEGSLSAGQSLIDILAAKASNESWKGMSIGNYMHAKGDQGLLNPNDYLGELSTRLFDTIEKYISGHATDEFFHRESECPSDL